MGDPRDPALDRREFLQRTALLGAGLLAGTRAWPASAADAPPAAAPADAAARVRAFRTLGRTGLRVSDVGFGSSSLAGDVALVRHALERGVNYFDTAESYQGGAAEETLGRALEGRRDEVLVASKVQAGPHDSRDEILRALEGSLRRLRTDHVDVYFNHAVNDVARLRNDEWREFSSRAKEAGKIRFTGMSGHGGRLVECIDHAVQHDLFDVFLVGYNFGQDPGFVARLTKDLDFVAVNQELPGALARARAAGMGVVAMKTLRGARLNDLRPYETGGATFAQAAFRWVLAGPNVDALVVTMRSPAQVDEYLGGSGGLPPTAEDLRLLARYEARHGREQCRYGCRGCADACPLGVPIADVLRVRMYAEDYGDAGLARREYAALGGAVGVASACASCAHRSCVPACGHGLDVASLAARAHRAAAG